LSSSAGMLIIYVVAFIAIFYFMAIRPQQRQRRAHQALLSALKKGDRIITSAGIYGTVKRVEENIVVVEVAKGVTMKISRRAVAEIIRDQAEARAAAPEGATREKSAPAEIEAADDDNSSDETGDGGDSSRN
jgi:preprotein translocase subunit YajC